jgi:predicted ATPase
MALIAEILETQEVLGQTTWIVATHSPVLLDHLPDEYLYVCRRVGGASEITPFTEADPFRRRQRIDEALRDAEPDPVGYRIRRGDFGG